MGVEDRIVDQFDNLENRIEQAEEEELNELKHWLFKENIRLRSLCMELEDERQSLEDEKAELDAERDELHEERIRQQEEQRMYLNHLAQQRQQIRFDEELVENKLAIIKRGFAELEADRKALKERETRLNRREIELDLRIRNNRNVEPKDAVDLMFSGVNSFLSLKKRYRDLMKMFHPDGGSGDAEMVLAINRTYERLKDSYESGKII